MARYKRVKTVMALAETGIHKQPHYREMAKISTQQANEINSDSIDEKEIEQVDVCIAELVKGQTFKCPILRKPKQTRDTTRNL